MEYENIAVTKELEKEIENLKSVLSIVSQLEREQAKRIIVYAWRYLDSPKEEVKPWKIPEGFIQDIIKKEALK